MVHGVMGTVVVPCVVLWVLSSCCVLCCGHCYRQRRQPVKTKTQELLDAQVESHRDEQESKGKGEDS